MANRELKGVDIDAVMSPAMPKSVRRMPHGKLVTPDNALWKIVGIGQSTTTETVDPAENKHAYLADAYADNHAPRAE